jgi:membrane protein YqaA with SNARE-associated domain
VPFGVDALVIVLAARHGDIFWIFPPIVTAVSLAGSALTYWAGRKAGHAGVPRLVPAHHLDRVKACLDRTIGGATVAAAILPPPFPLTAFLLTCGALDLNRWRFFLVFGVMRLIRFSAAALLARHYGEYLVQILESDSVQRAVVTAVLLTSITAVASGAIMWRRMRPQPA